MTNSLGSYMQEQMGMFGWSRDALAARAGLERCDLEEILESQVLLRWPEPEALLGLARAFNVPVVDLVLHAARACGLHIDADQRATDGVHSLGNEELMREVRRRLALGAATGGYLAKPDFWDGAEQDVQLS